MIGQMLRRERSPTCATGHRKRVGRKGVSHMIIDTDTHVMLPDAFEYVGPELRPLAPRLSFNEEDGSYDVVEFPGRPERVPGSFPQPRTGNKLRGAGFIEDRLEDFERLRVDKQMLMTNFTGWWSYLIEPQLGTAMAHSHNVSMLKVMQQYPDQFMGIALLALQDVDGSIAELRWAKEHGFAAAVVDHAYPVREHPYGTSLGEHLELWPFFEKTEELDMPLFIHNVLHGHSIQNCPRIMPLGLSQLCRSDGQINMVSMIHSGLLDDFPRLRFVIAEQGTAWIRPLAQMLDAGFTRAARDFASEAEPNPVSTFAQRAAAVPRELRFKKNKLTPSEYFRKNFYWTIETEEAALPDAIDFLAADRFLFATDYPHDDPGGSMKWRDVELLSVNKAISERAKERIFGENAIDLFKVA